MAHPELRLEYDASGLTTTVGCNGARDWPEGETHMLWTIFVVFLILWLLGFTLHVGGGLIHILLVIAVVVLVYNLITGRRIA